MIKEVSDSTHSDIGTEFLNGIKEALKVILLIVILGIIIAIILRSESGIKR